MVFQKLTQNDRCEDQIFVTLTDRQDMLGKNRASLTNT